MSILPPEKTLPSVDFSKATNNEINDFVAQHLAGLVYQAGEEPRYGGSYLKRGYFKQDGTFIDACPDYVGTAGLLLPLLEAAGGFEVHFSLARRPHECYQVVANKWALGIGNSFARAAIVALAMHQEVGRYLR